MKARPQAFHAAMSTIPQEYVACKEWALSGKSNQLRNLSLERAGLLPADNKRVSVTRYVRQFIPGNKITDANLSQIADQVRVLLRAAGIGFPFKIDYEKRIPVYAGIEQYPR